MGHGMGANGFHFRVEEADPERVAIVLPGRGYTAQAPLLSYPAHALSDLGWTTRALIWDGEPTDARQVYSEVLQQAAQERPRSQHLVIGKSLGTLALPMAAALRMPGAWLTPLLSGEQFGGRSGELLAAVGSLVADRTPVLLAGGTADPSWDSEAARRSGGQVVEVADANHSLEVRGDWRRSLDALRRVTDAVVKLATDVQSTTAHLRN